MSEYDDIIDLPHPEPRRHQRMGARERAAQFMPFAALTGYEALVRQTVAEMTARPELSENEIEEINQKLRRLREKGQGTAVSIRCVRERFGSKDVEICVRQGKVSRVDADRGIILLDDEGAVFFSDILDIDEIAGA